MELGVYGQALRPNYIRSSLVTLGTDSWVPLEICGVGVNANGFLVF